MSRRSEPPGVEDLRIIRGVAAPGASATTFGSTVFVRAGVTLTDRLRHHEHQHALQYHELGWIGFLTRYVVDYLRWRLRRHGHKGAYRRIRYEVSAEWRARRLLGIGVVGVPAGPGTARRSDDDG